MFKFILVAISGLMLLYLSELIRRRVRVLNEYSRKTYHVVHALVFAVAPFLVSYKIIILLELLLFGEMLIVRKYKLLPWLYEVGRISWGDLFTIAGVVSIALLKPDPWIFLVAMLHLAFADTIAALVGKKYGKTTRYKVFGQEKSLAGSVAFYCTSLFIMTVTVMLGVLNHSPEYALLILPPLVTITENVSIFGSDNFVIPVVVVILLRIL